MKINNILWGLVFIILGLIFGLNALSITNIDIFFDGWWTLFIILPCIINLFKDKDKTGDFIGLVIGLTLLLCTQNLINFEIVLKLTIPCVLVIIGLSFIFKDIINSKIKNEIKKINRKDNHEYYATFSSQDLDFSNEVFNGADINSVFGEVKCDLRDSKIEEDVIINVSAIFGSVKIYVPKDLQVKIISNSIFGGVSNKIKNSKDSKSHILYINSTCIFGGVDIK